MVIEKAEDSGPQGDTKCEESDRISILCLIAANLIVIALTLVNKWDIFTVMWVYWTQSFIIGLFWMLRILTHENLYWTCMSREETTPVYMKTLFRFPAGLFFVFHYGAFHMMYYLFLRMQIAGERMPVPAAMIIFSAGIFFIEELISFLRRPEQQRTAKVALSKFMLFPYQRILPMHFTIFVAIILEILRATGVIRDISQGYRMLLLLLFLVLKTIADVGMHIKERRGFPEPLLKIDLVPQ
jgi:hypothetical protein